MKFIAELLLSLSTMASFACSSQAQSSRETDNLISFAKAYGYVKYFHPSTEADQVDWGWFSVYGSAQVLECQNKEDLLQTMQQIFEPISPTLIFCLTEPIFSIVYVSIANHTVLP
ncbi:hypothetical protein J2X69_003870 [Algoriphagus sp. 4150]|uniref:hypothetical protein n=1 Tax=Algoriphagus sp. 4150 TaxID=2817756 RepID=UPI002859222E|nr:hypothetical protein [Algoriphagus sp. 4150]MDR7131506.1 hypothetical protein [Algoriphagus sp. 4150]